MLRNQLILSVFIVACMLSVAAPNEDLSTLTDVNGVRHCPFSDQETKATVLFFVLPDCPVSNAHAPEIKRICAEYAKKQVAAFIVYVDPELSVDAARKHAKEYGFDCPLIRDSSLEWVKQTGVTIAPEVAVLGPDGKQLYRGRINNLYADLGKRRPKPTQHDLRDALDAIVAGKPVPQVATTSIGCFIQKPIDKQKTPK